VDRLCRWQAALFPESQPNVTIGRLREGSVQVESKASETMALVHLLAVPRERLEPELDRFVTWFNDSGSLDGLTRAAVAHLWFVTLHPFDDGNGRVGRALADLTLAQDRSPRTRIPGLVSARILQVRPAYYAALENAQSFSNGLEVTPWIGWFMDQVAEAATQTETIIRHTLAKGAFWARHRQTPINDRQRKVLNRLLDAGPDGFQGGMTTRKYASLTHCSPITASRDLAALATVGLLRTSGAGRSTAYQIPWDDVFG
jgi:Fic family protein